MVSLETKHTCAIIKVDIILYKKNAVSDNKYHVLNVWLLFRPSFDKFDHKTEMHTTTKILLTNYKLISRSNPEAILNTE